MLLFQLTNVYYVIIIQWFFWRGELLFGRVLLLREIRYLVFVAFVEDIATIIFNAEFYKSCIMVCAKQKEVK